MADSIKIGNLDISSFKVGSDDCKIYLGDTLLYPQSTTPNYFRFVAREDGQFKLSGNSVSYSLDSGTTWGELQSDTYSPTVSSGNCIMLKATNPTLVSGGGIGRFFSSGQFDVEGNIMSLVYGDDFETATTLTNNGQFRSLFDSNTNVINASGLTIPSSNVPQNGYRSMFYGCSSLVTAPTVFPATTLGESCYKYTFSGCTSLTTAPELPATTLQTQCYEYMFSYCISLTTAPDINASILPYRSCRYMFSYCHNLNYIKCLATDISATQCTTNWVAHVASSGTFRKNPNMTSWPTGANGIPNNWQIQDYGS